MERNLPDEIKNLIKTALASGDDTQIHGAMKEMAQYLAYLGDCDVKGGEFGQGGGCDDMKYYGHETAKPSYKDYQKYMTDSRLSGVRNSLANGDIKQLCAAFGFDASLISNGSSRSFSGVVNTAMDPLHDAWKNEVLIGQEKTTDAIYQDIMKNGQDSVWAQQYPGIVQKVVSDSTENCAMAKDIGLPSTVPGADITTVADLDNAITKYEEKLNTIGDDAQLANTDLQNILQKQQQTLQMMSNISKMLSDTALAVIRKIG